jgi:hypothetical protein
MMHFMDAKAMFFSQNWEDTARSWTKKHKFRTHTKKELESFERKHGKPTDMRKTSFLV